MVRATQNNDEVTILSRAIQADNGNWPAEVARGILSIALSPADRDRMSDLATQSAAGRLSPDEELEIESYRQATRLLELLKAKARSALSSKARSLGPTFCLERRDSDRQNGNWPGDCGRALDQPSDHG